MIQRTSKSTKQSTTKHIVVSLLVGLWFAIALSLFSAYYFPFGEALNRTFWSGLAMPLFWCAASLYLLSRTNYPINASFLAALGTALIAFVAGALIL